MKKISIYGDSFAANVTGWPSFLKNYFNGEIDIFAVSGTSTNYSYMRFLETHENYDLIIFIWSIDKRNSLITKDFKNNKYTVHGVANSNINHSTKSDLINSQKEIRKNISEFHKKDVDLVWLGNEVISLNKYPSKNVLNEIAMRDSVKLRRPDSINIEATSNPQFRDQGMANIVFSDLCQLLSKLNVDIELDRKNYNDDPDKRPNHLTLKQNQEFAEYLYRHINETDFDIHTTFLDPRKYYTMSNSLEESGFVLANFETVH